MAWFWHVKTSGKWLFRTEFVVVVLLCLLVFSKESRHCADKTAQEKAQNTTYFDYKSSVVENG